MDGKVGNDLLFCVKSLSFYMLPIVPLENNLISDRALTNGHKTVRKTKMAPGLPDDVSWLAEVREVRHPINQIHPILVRDLSRTSGAPVPHPTEPYPERHPYCEFLYNFQGRATQFIGTEKAEKGPNDIMMLGPGVPHYAIQKAYPARSINIHFLPTLLFEMGPEGDGVRMMARFTAARRTSEWIIHPPKAVGEKVAACVEQMAAEAKNPREGSEFRLRSLLMEALVEILRWEQAAKVRLDLQSSALNWTQVERALRFIYENYTEPLYVEQIARAAGLSVNGLQSLFREALGMSCVKYLRAYRISHATSLLAIPRARVTEVALAVGFETLSHFNVSFRNFAGMSPAAYIQSRRQNRS
jgi:AraC-like DNA-binding protein